MALGGIEAGQSKVLGASANVKPTSGVAIGILCHSSTAGTATLYDDAGTGTTNPISGIISLTAGQYYPFPVAFGAGLYCVVGGTASITVIYL